jgi:hypothetical protein
MRETPSRQRLRYGVCKTAFARPRWAVPFGRLMHSFSAAPANYHYTMRIHPALTSFTAEFCGTLARLAAYVITLALPVLGFLAFWEQLPDATAMAPSDKSAWSLAERSSRAFSVSQFNLYDKTETYEIYRHPEGGRKDLFQWSGADKKPVAELEIYRPGNELNHLGPAIAEIAGRMDPGGMHELEAAGIIGSKFGAVTLLRLVGGADTRACLGFVKHVDEPNVRISGWSCEGDNRRDNLPARRAAISCMLNPLTLLSAGNDLKLADLFARAELRGRDCTASAMPAVSADWLTGTDNPQLRGAF